MTSEDLAFAEVATLRDALARRTVSSVELARLYLDRLERYGPVYGAVVTVMRDRALREAEAADRERAAGRIRGPLHGIPYGAKDLLAAVGAPTTWGAAPYRDQRFDFDATVVTRLRDAGAVLLAKLAMVELAGGFGYNEPNASFTGPGRTPWNRAYWSGGSSSGPAAATAAGLVGFAIGSETSGSILHPSVFCGVTGLRPTYGRVSRHGAMALSWTLDKLGPTARSAADAETVLRTIAGADPRDPTAVAHPLLGPEAGARPRIAVMLGATRDVMPAVRANFEASLRVLESVAEIVPDVPLPDLPYTDVTSMIIRCDAASAFRDLLEGGKTQQLAAPSDRTGGFYGYEARAADYIDAQRTRRVIIEQLSRVLAPFDALATPTRGTVSFTVETPLSRAYPGLRGVMPTTPLGNLLGWPAISLPNGFGEHGLPTGIALLGRPFAEATLTAIGRAYQARTSFHRMRPRLVSG